VGKVDFDWAQFCERGEQDWVDWDVLAEPLAQLIQEHLERGEGVLLALDAAEAEAPLPDDPLSRKIIELLNTEIRPAVAMDGGDIVFQRFETAAFISTCEAPAQAAQAPPSP